MSAQCACDRGWRTRFNALWKKCSPVLLLSAPQSLQCIVVEPLALRLVIDMSQSSQGAPAEAPHLYTSAPDLLLPKSTVNLLMKSSLPPHAKTANPARVMVQNCVTEFIMLVTGEYVPFEDCSTCHSSFGLFGHFLTMLCLLLMTHLLQSKRNLQKARQEDYWRRRCTGSATISRFRGLC